MTQAHRNSRIAAVLTTLVLVAGFVPNTLAGGPNARVEGPARDGRTYTVRTFACSNPAALDVSGFAEGIVGGKRRSLPLLLATTEKPGVYRFERPWPAEGRWVVRLRLGGGNSPVTLASLDARGRVLKNELVWSGDGTAECALALDSNAHR